MIRRLNKNSVVISWGYFFAGLLVFVSVIFGLFFYNAETKQKHHLEQNAEYVYHVALNNVKYQFSALANHYIRLLESDGLKYLLRNVDIDYFRDYNASNLLDEVVRQNDTDSAMVSYVYFRDRGIVFSYHGIVTAKRYYDEHFSSDMTFDEWDKLHEGTEIVPYEVEYTDESRESSVMLCMPLYEMPLVGAEASNEVVVGFVLNKNRFFALNENLTWVEDAAFYFVDADAQVLFRSKSGIKADNMNEIIDESGDEFSALDYFYYKNKKIGLLFELPYDSLYPKQLSWQLIMIFCFILLLTGIVFMTVLFIRHNYYRIKHLLGLLSVSDSDNEMVAIEKNIQRLLTESMDNSESRRIMERNLKNVVLRMLLYVPDETENVRAYLTAGGMSIGRELICVGILTPEEAYRKHFEECIPEIMILLDEYLAAMPDPGYAVEVQRYNIAVLLGVSENAEQTEKQLCKVRNTILEMYGISLNYVVSVPHFLSNIPTAYQDALYRLEGKTLDENPKEVLSNMLFYSLEDKVALFDALNMGQKKVVDQLLDLIFDKFHQSAYSDEITNVFAVEMVSLLLEVTQRKKFESDAISGALHSNRTYIFGDTVEEMEKNLRQIMEVICMKVAGNERSTNRQICEKMYEYISENYHDPSLSLKVIADKFGITSSYASSNFSRIYGESPTYFINKFRIEEGTQLLQDPSLTVEKIAQIIGYGHERTFSRNFKKVKGVYPQDYRKML